MNLNLNKEPGDKLYADDVDNIVSAINSKQDSFNLSDYVLKSELPTGGTVDLSAYYTKSQIDAKGYLTSFVQDFSYNSLTDKPTIPSVESLVTLDYLSSQGYLKAIPVIDYSTLSNKPIIPDSYTKQQSDAKYLTSFTQDFNYNSLINKPTIPSIAGLATETYVNSQGFIKSVGTIDYNTLSNKPAIPTTTDGLAEGTSNKYYADSLVKTYSDTQYSKLNHTHAYSSLTGLPDLSTYLTSSSVIDYNGLSNKPNLSSYATQSYVTGLGYLTGVTFAQVSAKPTTVAGYGITDAVSTSAIALKSDLSLTILSKTANYTLIATDNGKMITMSVASANTLTVPANGTVALPVGSQIIIQQIGAGQTTITAASGVTINSVGSKIKTNVQWSTVTLIKTGTNIWALIGDLA